MTTETTEQDPRLVALGPFFESCRKNIQEYKSLAAQVAAAEGNRDAAIEAWMEGSDDEDAVAIREAINRAQAKLKALAEAAVEDSQLSPEETAKLKAQFEVTTQQVKASSRALRGLATPFGLDINPILSEMGDPFLPKATTPGAGTSLPRPSVYVTVTNLDNGQSWNVDSLGQAAALLTDLPLEELGKLYAKAGGVAYEEIAKIKEPQEFTWKNEATPNSSTWQFKTTPKETHRGRKAVSATPKDPQELPAAS